MAGSVTYMGDYALRTLEAKVKSLEEKLRRISTKNDQIQRSAIVLDPLSAVTALPLPTPQDETFIILKGPPDRLYVSMQNADGDWRWVPVAKASG